MSRRNRHVGKKYGRAGAEPGRPALDELVVADSR
jgi:hypothetical protein